MAADHRHTQPLEAAPALDHARPNRHRLTPPSRWPGVSFADAARLTVKPLPGSLQRKRPVYSGCGARGLPIKDHRVRRWRHLDVGALRCVIECRLRRLYCPGCGDLPELVQWTLGGARYTRDFNDLVAFIAQQMNLTQVTKLMRTGWEMVRNILERVVC